MEILQIQNSCSKQFTLSVSPVSTEQCLLPASCDRQELFQNSMENSYSSVSRTFEFSILPENPSFGVSFSRRHHHWTNSGSSRCKNCWRIWHRGCNSINCEPRIHNSLCDIQRRRSSCEWNSWSQTRAQVQQWIASKPSRIMKKEKVTRSHKETWAAPSTKETSARLVIFATRVSLFTKRTIPTNEKKWTMIHAHSRYGGDLAVSVSKMVRTMLRHYDQDERQRDGSIHWDSIKPVWMKAFAHEGARDFDGYWLHLRNGSNSTKINNGNICYFQAIQDTLVVFQ